jgi:hypothetical protein
LQFCLTAKALFPFFLFHLSNESLVIILIAKKNEKETGNNNNIKFPCHLINNYYWKKFQLSHLQHSNQYTRATLQRKGGFFGGANVYFVFKVDTKSNLINNGSPSHT